MLGNDSSAISTLRCLKLYLERLGCNHLDADTMHCVAGSAFKLVRPDIICPNHGHRELLHALLIASHLRQACWCNACVTWDCGKHTQGSVVRRPLGTEKT